MCWRKPRRARALAAILAMAFAGQASAVTLVPPKPNVFFGVSDRGTTAEFNEVAGAAALLGLLQHIAHPPRLDSQRFGVRGAALAQHRHLHQLRLLPGCKHGLAEDGADRDQAGAD